MYGLNVNQYANLEKKFPGSTTFIIACENVNEYRYYRANEYILNGWEKARMSELENMYKSIGWMTDDGQWTELYYQSGVEQPH